MDTCPAQGWLPLHCGWRHSLSTPWPVTPGVQLKAPSLTRRPESPPRAGPWSTQTSPQQGPGSDASILPNARTTAAARYTYGSGVGRTGGEDRGRPTLRVCPELKGCRNVLGKVGHTGHPKDRSDSGAGRASGWWRLGEAGSYACFLKGLCVMLTAPVPDEPTSDFCSQGHGRHNQTSLGGVGVGAGVASAAARTAKCHLGRRLLTTLQPRAPGNSG